MSKEAVVTFENVTKSYKMNNNSFSGLKSMILSFPQYLRALKKSTDFVALSDLSFQVNIGGSFGIIGPNGSGKSTTLGLIAGVLKATEGKVTVGARVSPLLELGAGFHPELSGRDNIILNGILLGMTRAQVQEKMDDIIAFSELEASIRNPIRTYSSGMVARLGFSVVVHLEPELLLIDEVLAIGDEKFQKKCIQKMNDFRSRGITMVFVSHDLKSVEEMCDQAALLDHGKLIDIGEPEKVISSYHTLLTD